jgi:hypothetical protein
MDGWYVYTCDLIVKGISFSYTPYAIVQKCLYFFLFPLLSQVPNPNGYD